MSKIQSAIQSDQSTSKIETNVKNDSNTIKKPEKQFGLVHIGLLPENFFEQDLRDHFSHFGEITNARMSLSKKRFAYVAFADLKVAAFVADLINMETIWDQHVIAKYIPPENQYINVFTKNEPLQREKTAAEEKRDRLKIFFDREVNIMLADSAQRLNRKKRREALNALGVVKYN